jgi:predicted Fe-Mo cluster-binding NifX family protein
MRIAIPTKGEKGLKEELSDPFSRAPTFTIVMVEDNEVIDVQVLHNSAKGLKQGAGPLAASSLKEQNVDAVLSGQLGSGAKTILDNLGISSYKVDFGENVKRTIINWLRTREVIV